MTYNVRLQGTSTGYVVQGMSYNVRRTRNVYNVRRTSNVYKVRIQGMSYKVRGTRYVVQCSRTM